MKIKLLNKCKSILGILLVILLFTSMNGCNSTVKPVDLRCEYRVDPLGIDNVKPRLSWKLFDIQKTRGQKQTAFQILVASSLKELYKDNGDLWDSGKKEVSRSVNNVYAGKSLTSGQQCYWKVRVWDAFGKVSEWSSSARFTIGLLNNSDWKGSWIYKSDQIKTDHNWYRKDFILDEKPSSALIYVGSFGYHELYVNGEKVTDDVMNPVLSNMKIRIPYLTYDIKDKLKKGKNVIGIWHAAGWTRWHRITEYRNPPFIFKAQAEIKTRNKLITLATDTTWKCKKSVSEYYGNWDILDFGGEKIDARRKEPNWNKADYDDSGWMHASIYNENGQNTNSTFKIVEDKPIKATNLNKGGRVSAKLSAQMVEPQVKYEIVSPIGVSKNDDGTYIIDMGRNYSGYFEINLHHGAEGDSVLFEISDQKGQTSSWCQKSEYIFDKTGEGLFTNRFNIAGGRWITVTGLNYKPELSDIKGYVITCNRKRISKFECSNDLINKIYKTNLATYIATTLDGILVDCPHRERRGWGEVTVAAMYGDALPNFESGAYMDQYMQYMRDAQFPDGRIRAIINEQDRPFLMWKANSPITVWETYRMMGDKKVLRDNYASVQKWMQWLYNNSNYEIGGALKIGERGKREFPGLGDWCTPKGNFWDSCNSPDAVHFNNCLYAYMLGCAVKIATALNKTDDVKIYLDRLKVQQKATHKLSYDPATGNYGNGKQVNQLFALISGVTPASERQKVYNNLVDKVLYGFPYYDTGSSGQALYTRYFTEYGERMDLIYELLQDSRHPSYGYFIRQGANVWPERWSAVGNSRIHTCYTGIGGYFIKGFGGIRPDPEKLGMRNVLIKPAPVGDLTYANTEFESMYGNIVVNWKKTDSSADYHIEIPVNCTAKVYIPAVSKMNVKESNVFAEKASYITYLGSERSDAVGNYIIYKVESGVYDFKVDKLPETTYPDPQYKGNNLSMIGRMSASSMYIESEKNPGFEAFKANDNNYQTCWKAGDTENQWLEVTWVKPQTFDNVEINEVGDNINSFKIQYWNGSKWVDILSGNKCGNHKKFTFNPVITKRCRFYINYSSQAAKLSEFKIHNSKK